MNETLGYTLAGAAALSTWVAIWIASAKSGSFSNIGPDRVLLSDLSVRVLPDRTGDQGDDQVTQAAANVLEMQETIELLREEAALQKAHANTWLRLYKELLGKHENLIDKHENLKWRMEQNSK